MQFDTLSKKPKLYHLLVLAVLTAAVAAALILSKTEKHVFLVVSILCGFFLIAFVLLVRALILQIRYNPYSYNTIFYTGFAMFDLFVLAAHLILAWQVTEYPEAYTGWSCMTALLGSAKNFAILSLPLTLVFASALCISNLVLIRKEGKSLVNILGIILSFFLVAGSLFLFWIDYYVMGSELEVMIHELWTNLYAAIYLYYVCMLSGTIFADALAARYEPECDKDFLIILGCGLRPDGTPTPLLAGRIERALKFAKKQKQKTGKDLIFVTSGGQGSDEVISESAAMKRYLTEHGVPEEQIIEEDRSTDTFENMKFSKEKIMAVNPEGKIAFSTTNYHVFRSGIFARRVKMRAVGMGAKTKWYFWPNAAVREFAGLMTEHRGKQLLIMGSLIVLYTILTLLSYNVW